MNAKWRKKVILLIVAVFMLGAVQVIQANDSTRPVAIVSTLSALQTAIAQADDGDIIAVDAGMNVLQDAVIGDSNKRITIVRNDSTSLIYVKSGANILFRNLTFDGLGISSQLPFLDISNPVTFDNVTFKNFVSSANGGAVNASGGEVSFKNCSFENNAAMNGGHIAVSGSTILSVDNCSFTTGSATGNGGAILNDAPSATLHIVNSTIKANSAGNLGGGLFNRGAMTISENKIHANTANVGGSDIANQGWMGFDDSKATLDRIYANDDEIKPIGWVADYSDNAPSSRYLVLDYETVPKSVILAQDSLGIAGDGVIQGLEAGKLYEVILSDLTYAVKSDGTLSPNSEDGAALIGTEIIGLTNGQTYLVREVVQEEEPPLEEEPPTDEPPVEEEPVVDDPTDELTNETPVEDETNNQNLNDNTNSNGNSINNEHQDNDSTNASSGQTGSIDSTQDQSSESNSSSDTDVNVEGSNPNSTVNNYFNPNSSSSFSPENKVQSSRGNEPIVNVSPSVPGQSSSSIEINDEGAAINININVGETSEAVKPISQPTTDMLTFSSGNDSPVQNRNEWPWYEIIKIGLLAAILLILVKRS